MLKYINLYTEPRKARRMIHVQAVTNHINVNILEQYISIERYANIPRDTRSNVLRHFLNYLNKCSIQRNILKVTNYSFTDYLRKTFFDVFLEAEEPCTKLQIVLHIVWENLNDSYKRNNCIIL